MHIALVEDTTFAGPRGPTILEYARVLSKEGHDVTVVCRRQAPEIPSIKRLQVSEIPSESASAFWCGVRRRIRQADVDIVHVFHSPGSSVARLGQGAVKYVCDLKSAATQLGLGRVMRDIAQLTEASMFDAVFALHNVVRPDLSFLLRKKKVHTFPLGCNYELLSRPSKSKERLREELRLAPGRTMLLYLGTITEVRRLEFLLRMALTLRQAGNQALTVVVGGGSDLHRLERLAQEWSLGGDIVFAGPVSYLRIHEYLWAADIGIAYIRPVGALALQLPVKTIEYMAAGLPVVASDTIGNRFYVRNQVNGLICPDSEEEFAKSIGLLCADRDLRASLGHQAQAFANGFDWHRIVMSMLVPAYEETMRQ